MTETSRKYSEISTGMIAFIAAVFVMKMASSVLVPFAFAFFLTMILHPSVQHIAASGQKFLGRFKKFKNPDDRTAATRLLPVVSIIIVVLIFVFVALLLYHLAKGQLQILATQGQNIINQVSETLSSLVASLPFLSESKDMIAKQLQSLVASVWRILPWAAGPLISGMLTFVWVLFLTVFLLLGRSRLLDKIAETLPAHRFRNASGLFSDIEGYVRKYLRTKVITSTMTGVLVALILLVAGLPAAEASLWGFVSFILNFIPIYGSIVAGTMITLWTLGAHGQTGWFVMIAVIAANLIISNGVEPKLLQFRLCLGPVTILMSVIFWGWLWGAWGVFLAVPIMVGIKLFFDAVEPDSLVSVLLEA